MSQMSIQEIKQCLPHRYPFLLVDRVVSIEPGESIVALKNVSINEPFFQGHFPIKAVMPGVLIVEAMAQAGGILAYMSAHSGQATPLVYLATIGETRFKKVVEPGDQLELKVKVTKRKNSVWKFRCQALVNAELVCETEMTSMEGKVT